MNLAPRPLYIVSDAHLGAGSDADERLKSSRLRGFFKRVTDQGADLVILGDLFDFWFEYKNAIPRFHFDHLMALRDLVKAGRHVYYVAGNHDFWAGPFLQGELGVTYCEDELVLEHSGRRICLAHGDGWPPNERAYRFMKRVFRNRAAIALFRMISPDIGFPLARWLSHRSRGRHHLPQGTLDVYADLARRRLLAGVDLVVIGHLHECRHVRWPEGEWIIGGDWIKHFSYTVVDASGARLCLWRDEGADVRVDPVDSEPVSRQAARGG